MLPSVRDGRWVQALWHGGGMGARAARAALAPAELVFSAMGAARTSLYDTGVLQTRPTAVPALSVGNLTVGGTGKTPMAAYLARRLRDAGAVPGIVLRGYGDDEPLVHRTLNPDVPVIVSPDRVEGSRRACDAGCDVVVLDDAFQHRRASRVADVVLVSADAWPVGRRRLLPAGPWREPLSALGRASLVVVTRKAASRDRADDVLAAVAREVARPWAIVHLTPGELRRLDGSEVVALDAMRGERVLAISGIGDPSAFHAQLALHGATVEAAVFGDHHRYSAEEVATLSARGAECARVVCTLKDAVKLGSLWPHASPLWYVSQRVDVERGEEALNAVLAATLAARSASTHLGRPGPPGPPD